MQKIRIRKRGQSYSYSFDIAKKPRRMKEKGGFSTEKEAYEAGILAYAEWKNGNIAITSTKITLTGYLQSWLEQTARPNLKRTTYHNYKTAIASRITPYLGEIYLQELRPRHIDQWLNTLAKQGLSHGTIAQAKTILSTALKYAIYPAELIQANPTQGLAVPRSAPKKIIKRTVITKEQFESIPKDSRYYPAYKILYHTGLRISEALGLTWDDIDLTAGKITVTQQLINSSYFETPKTETSSREFYADKNLLAYLRSLRLTQKADELRLGEAYQLIYENSVNNRKLIVLPKKITPSKNLVPRPLICRTPQGQPLISSSMLRNLQKHGLNSHSFRHTHATKLIEAGAKPVDVAARLGHADATITQNLYTHDTEDMKLETARIFDAIVGK